MDHAAPEGGTARCDPVAGMGVERHLTSDYEAECVAGQSRTCHQSSRNNPGLAPRPADTAEAPVSCTLPASGAPLQRIGCGGCPSRSCTMARRSIVPGRATSKKARCPGLPGSPAVARGVPRRVQCRGDYRAPRWDRRSPKSLHAGSQASPPAVVSIQHHNPCRLHFRCQHSRSARWIRQSDTACLHRTFRQILGRHHARVNVVRSDHDTPMPTTHRHEIDAQCMIPRKRRKESRSTVSIRACFRDSDHGEPLRDVDSVVHSVKRHDKGEQPLPSPTVVPEPDPEQLETQLLVGHSGIRRLRIGRSRLGAGRRTNNR